MEVFEVGAAGFAPLTPPEDNDAGPTRVRPGDEVTLGWRPAGGLEMRNRAHWIIREKLGEGGFGEVWLAEHEKTHTRRVFKFCFDPQRVPGLKREVVLFRLLRDALGDRRDIARVTDYQFDENPYFIEYEYIGAGSLPEWAESHGGISKVPLETRIQIVAQAAEALGAAHSVGVIHKDVKPSNILIANHNDDRNSLTDIHPVLIDFGIGMLTDRSQLQRHDITEFNFTHSDIAENDSSRTGTRMYAPPESLVDRPHTVQGDVYALGVLLYQMVIGDFARPLAPGWEGDVTDELLREDIAACVQGEPTRRLSNGIEIAKRLEDLPQRRIEREQRIRASRAQVRRKQALRVMAVLLVITSVLAGAMTWIMAERSQRAREAEAAHDRIKIEADKAIAVTDFMREMISGADPSRANKRDVKVSEILDAAAKKIDQGALKSQPAVEGAIRSAIGRTYLTLGIYPAAAPQLQRALELASMTEPNDRRTLRIESDLGVLDLYTGKYADAEKRFQSVLEKRRTALGPDDPDVAESLHNLCLVYGEEHKPADAKKWGEQALALREKLFGPESLEVASSLQYLGLYATDANDFESAERLSKRSLEIRKRLLPPNHFEIGNSENNLGLIYLRKSDEPQALEHFTKALENFEESLAPDHPNVGMVNTNLAGIHMRQMDFKGAEPYAQRALEIAEKTLPPDHPDLALALNVVGVAQYSNQNYEAAAAMMKRATGIMENKLGPDHPNTITFRWTLAFIYRDAHRFDEAMPLFRQVIESFQRRNQPDFVVQAKISMIEGMIWAKDFASAEPLAVETLESAKKLENPSKSKQFMNDTLTLLVELYHEWPKPEKEAAYQALLAATTQPSTAAAPSTSPASSP